MSLPRFAWRQVRKGALIWSIVLATVVASGVATYRTSYSTDLARRVFAHSVGRLPALQALYGRTVHVDTVGGFITWRYGDLMTLVVGLWALLAVTRILRGDEEMQRIDLLLAGTVPARHLMVIQLAAVCAGCGLITAVVAVTAAICALPAGGSVQFGFMVGAGGVCFGSFAALTSQLFGTRRRAAGWAGAALGASYLVRALADGTPRLRWLGWLSPLGWTERIEPFTGFAVVPIALILATAAVLLTGAVLTRQARDTGAGLVRNRFDRHPPRVLRSSFALDWRLSTRALLAWSGGVFAELFVLGYLTRDMARFAADNRTVDDMVTKMYGYSMHSPVGFVSLAFTVVALALGIYAGTQMITARDDESAGLGDTLLVAGTSRARWFAGRVAVAFGAVLVLALVAAIAAWVGAGVSGSAIGLRDTLAASANVVPVTLLFGGLTALAFGAVPGATTSVAFGTVALSFLIQILGGLSGMPRWFTKISPLAHLAPVPAAAPNTTATVVMLVVAAASTGVGLVAFQRRDFVAG